MKIFRQSSIIFKYDFTVHCVEKKRSFLEIVRIEMSLKAFKKEIFFFLIDKSTRVLKIGVSSLQQLRKNSSREFLFAISLRFEHQGKMTNISLSNLDVQSSMKMTMKKS